MIGYQRPSKTGRFRLRQDQPEIFQKIMPILVILKYLAALYSSSNDVVQRSSCVDARLSWHAKTVPSEGYFVKLKS